LKWDPNTVTCVLPKLPTWSVNTFSSASTQKNK